MPEMRFAYADPPYPKKARKHYAKEAAADGREAGEVDFPALITRLVSEYPDGWALSCNSTNLRDLLPLCPPETRVMPWIKRFAKIKPGVNPTFAWEPVLVCGGRKHPKGSPFIRDWVDAVPVMTSATVIGPKVVGQKPDGFLWWLFRVLNAQAGDTMDDLFPGSGAVGRAWEAFCAQPVMPERPKRQEPEPLLFDGEVA